MADRIIGPVLCQLPIFNYSFGATDRRQISNKWSILYRLPLLTGANPCRKRVTGRFFEWVSHGVLYS
jgi:hypothetical protein